MNKRQRKRNQKEAKRNPPQATPNTNSCPEIGPELNAKTAEQTTTESEHKKESALKNDWHRPLGIPITDWLVAFFTLVIMGSSIVYTVYAKKQWRVMRESNTINRESLYAVQRPFVTFNAVDSHVINITDPKTKQRIKIFQIGGKWENVGNTPAIDIIGAFDVMDHQSVEPTDETFLAKQQTTAIGTAVLGPKGSFNIGNFHVPISFADDADTGRYFWGWLYYRDNFKDSKPHLAEFCAHLNAAQTVAPDTYNFNVTLCRKHNCVDDLCGDYEAIVKRAQELKASQ